jgi:hypothetical protein
MKGLIPFLFALCLTIPAVAVASCTPIADTHQIWTSPSLRWVFIGEIHGSNETPAAFRDLVCDALANGKRVTVALERPTSEQAALDGILTAKNKNLPAAKAFLLGQPGWKEELDGRSSEAMLRLLLSLREFRTAHRQLSVFAFDAPYPAGAKGARDQALGQALLARGHARPRDLILILTGNVHGMEAPMFGYDTAAMYIPAAERLSLQVIDLGGESWTKTRDGACGASKGGAPDKGAAHARGISLDPTRAPYGKVDGVLSLGVPVTPSFPAVGDLSPAPPCRVKFLSQHPATSSAQ